MNFVQEIKDFMYHVEESVGGMLDTLDNGGDYEEKYNLILKMNGKELCIPFNADTNSRLERFLEQEIAEYNELYQVAKPGVWTPTARVICVKCHGPTFPRQTLSKEDMYRMDQPVELAHNYAITKCDDCGCDIQLHQQVAVEHNIVLMLKDLGYVAYMDQTGGMNSAAGLATTSGGWYYITFNWDGNNEYVISQYDSEGDPIDGYFDTVMTKGSFDEMIEYINTLKDAKHESTNTVD